MTRSVSIIFSFLVQIWEQPGAIPGWNQWLGALIILAAIFLVSMDHLARRAWAATKERMGCCGGGCQSYEEPTEQKQGVAKEQEDVATKDFEYCTTAIEKQLEKDGGKGRS